MVRRRERESKSSSREFNAREDEKRRRTNLKG